MTFTPQPPHVHSPPASATRLQALRQINTTNGRASFFGNVFILFNVADALAEADVTLPLSARLNGLRRVFNLFRSLVDFVNSLTDLTVLATLAAGSETLLDVLSSTPALHVFAPTDHSFLELEAALVSERSDLLLLPIGGDAALRNVSEIAVFAARLVDTWVIGSWQVVRCAKA